MDNTDGSWDRNKMIDFFAFMLESLYFYSQSLAKTGLEITRKFMENIHISELVDEISDKLGEHVVLRFLVVATAISCALPVVLFMVFGVVSVIITFTGFLFIEGTLLAMGGLCMIMCLVSMIMVMSVLVVGLGVFYMLAVKFMVLIRNFDSSRLFGHLRPSLINNGVLGIFNSVDDVHQD